MPFAREVSFWKSRFETEGMGRVEDLEMARNKLHARIVEADETVENLQAKISNAEKAKGRMDADLEEISMEYERVHASAIISEKRARNFDKVGTLLYSFTFSLACTILCC